MRLDQQRALDGDVFPAGAPIIHRSDGEPEAVQIGRFSTMASQDGVEIVYHSATLERHDPLCQQGGDWGLRHGNRRFHTERMRDITPESEAFGARLEASRRYHGRRSGRPRLKAKVFADELGVNPWRYRRWERGEIEPPLSVLKEIRRVTGLSLDWLICDLAPGDVILPDLAVATPGDRLRWAREITHASSVEAALAMSVPIDQWVAYESGRTPIPLEVAQQFAHRFSVSLDYLYAGKMEGVFPQTRDALLARRPQLLAPSRHPHNGDGRTDGAGTATLPGSSHGGGDGHTAR